MSTEDLSYDEELEVKFILNHLPQDLKEKFTEDNVYYLLDATCDFYDNKDFLDEDDEEKEEQELVRFLIDQSKKDDIGDFTKEEMILFLRAEDAYLETLDIEDLD
ncbi:hypothetical protein LJC06_01120 [Bacteroidales bacterium OttesenSCG-928-I14]|nr:hypothetical protein [Bacteroidales bacterium OttesenSCG-928-I14]